MKKIVLTTEQTNKLMGHIINEQNRSLYDMMYEDKRKIEVTCDFDYHGLRYKGGEINDILKSNFVVTYVVEPEWRSYGISSIYVYNISGPEEIEVEIEYYTDETSDDHVEEYITLKLDWENMINIEESDTLGYIGVSPDITITLENDNEGGLIVKSINVDVRKL